MAVAVLHALGALGAFTVWAPQASSMHLQPLGAAHNSTVMSLSGDGMWSAPESYTLPSGQQYVFLANGTTPLVDPHSLDVAKNCSGGVAWCSVTPEPYVWQYARRALALRDAVVYEMHVGTFTEEGTFDAAQARLGFLASLGVTAVELMPVAQGCSPEKGWGYCPTSVFAIRGFLGGSAGLKRFVDAAARWGMAVFVDVVHNHMARNGNLLRGYGEGVYFYPGSDRAATTPWGPRPHYSADGLRDLVAGSIVSFVDEFHVSGFRFDSTVCIRSAGAVPGDGNCKTDLPDGWRLLQLANTAYANGTKTLSFAEDAWSGAHPGISEAVDNTSAPAPPGCSGGAGFDGSWDYPWHMAMVDEVVGEKTVDVERVVQVCVAGRAGDVHFSENHDVSSFQHPTHPGRIPNRVARAGGGGYAQRKKALLLIGLAVACPGVPMILQGQELLTLANFTFPVPPVVDWKRATANATAGFVSAVAALLNLRTRAESTDTHALRDGTATALKVNASVGAVLRSSTDGAAVAAFVNFGNTVVTSCEVRGLPVDGEWLVRFNGDSKEYSHLYGGHCSVNTVVAAAGRAVVCVPPMSMVVLSPRPSA